MKKIEKDTEKRLELAMGRPREDMTILVKNLQDTVQEHIWKIYAYHKIKPQDVNGWLKSLNKHIGKLRTYNVQVGSSTKTNMTRGQLLEKFLTHLFEERDIEQLNYNWKGHGYPFVTLDDGDTKRLQTLATRYVDLILSKSGNFEVHPSELHE